MGKKKKVRDLQFRKFIGKEFDLNINQLMLVKYVKYEKECGR